DGGGSRWVEVGVRGQGSVPQRQLQQGADGQQASTTGDGLRCRPFRLSVHCRARSHSPVKPRRRTRTLPGPDARLFYKKSDRRRKAAMTPKLRLAFFTVAATLGYLGLAILGRGGFEAFFSHAALI